MIELLLVVPVAAFLWPFVVRMNRRLDGQQLMDDLRPNATDVAAIEAGLPRMKGDHR